MTVVLYHFDAAVCGAKVRLAMHEKGVSYEEVIVSGEALTAPDYLRLNPEGLVPTLVHNGAVLIESSIIMNYLEDAFQGPPLRPAGALQRAQMNLWMKLVDESWHPALGALTYALVARNRYLALSHEARQAAYAAIPDPVRRERRRDVVELGLDAPQVAPALRALGRMLTRMDEVLAGGPWLAGASFSLADAALAPLVGRLDSFGLLAEESRAARWLASVRGRPSWQAIATRIPPGYSGSLRTAAEPHLSRLVAGMGS